MKKISRFMSLITNITNWHEYTFNKGDRHKRDLVFKTKPTPITFEMHSKNYVIFKEIFVEDFYEIKTVLNLISKKPTIIDIGANVGFFDFLILSKLPLAQIHAYEPFESNCSVLHNSIVNNKLENNIFIHQQAVTDNPDGNITLYYKSDDEESSIASIYSTFDSRNLKSTQVQTTTLQQIFYKEKLTKVDILKMDCEGAEYVILLSTPSEVLKNIKLILLEVHLVTEEKYNPEMLKKFLEDNNFKVNAKEFTNGCFYYFAINENYEF